MATSVSELLYPCYFTFTTLLDAVAAKAPEIYRLIYAAFSCEPILVYGNRYILSRKRAQQGDPLGLLEFCEAIHSLLMNFKSTVKIGFMDDVTLAGKEIGLQLDLSKCEIVMDDFTAIADSIDNWRI